MIQEVMGPFGWPGAVFGLAGATWFGVKAFATIKNSNGGESRGWMKATLDRHTACLERLDDTMQNVDNTLKAIMQRLEGQ